MRSRLFISATTLSLLVVATTNLFYPRPVLGSAMEGGISTTSLKGPILSEQEWSHLAESPQVKAVPAKVDRVWRAIPGLSGWTLNLTQSQQVTAGKHDGKIHLVWNPELPPRRLADLPAEPIYRGPGRDKDVCLMFNVSWGEEYVPSLLGTLQKEKVRATFFLDGAWVKKHPDLAKDIAAAGHVIGSHGTGHPDFARLSDARLKSQIVGTNETILHTLGKRPSLLAPPAGSYDARTVRYAKQNGMYTILWTADSVDWRRPPANQIVQRVMHYIEPGGLVLMHPTAPTATALPSLIRELRGRGYHFKTVEQLVAEEPNWAPPTVLSPPSGSGIFRLRS